MPTYEYECTACGKEWELFQSIKADAERVCPKCRKRTAKRKIGIGAAILVGGKRAEPPQEQAKPANRKEPTVSQKPDSNSSDAKSKSAKDAANGPSKDGAKDASKQGDAAKSSAASAGNTASAANTGGSSKPDAEPAHESKATHPAREGRGVGNLNDALARARKQQEMRSMNRGPGSHGGGGGPGGKGGGKGGRPGIPRRPQGK